MPITSCAQNSWKLCATLNHYSKFVPILSSFTALSDLLIKLIVTSGQKKVTPKNRFIAPIAEKKYKEHLIPLIPIGGNIAYIFLHVKFSDRKNLPHAKTPSKAIKATLESPKTNNSSAAKIKSAASASKSVKTESIGTSKKTEMPPEELLACANNHLKNQNNQEAFKLMEKAALANHAEASFYLANMHLEGIGTPQNVKEAFSWFKKCALLGDARAYYKLGQIYENEDCFDSVKALKCFRRGSQLGHIPSIIRLGQLSFESKDLPLAYECFKAVGDRDSLALNSLGVMTLYGLGIEKDEAEAFSLFKKSAKLKEPIGMLNLGYCLAFGLGVKKDDSKAKIWFEKALRYPHIQSRIVSGFKNNEAITLDILGYLFEQGIHFSQDLEKAQKFYELSQKNVRQPEGN